MDDEKAVARFQGVQALCPEVYEAKAMLQVDEFKSYEAICELLQNMIVCVSLPITTVPLCGMPLLHMRTPELCEFQVKRKHSNTPPLVQRNTTRACSTGWKNRGA